MIMHFARRAHHAGLARLVCLCIMVWLAGLTQATGMAVAGQASFAQLTADSQPNDHASHGHHHETTDQQHHRDCPMAESTLCAQLCALVVLPSQPLHSAALLRQPLSAADLPLPGTPDRHPPSPPPRAAG